MQLTPSQSRAVEYSEGPLLIIAGAGTGKTTVLVEKINFLVRNNLARPEEILALTFTEKAAAEMEERVDKMLPYGYFQMWIATFHAFCDFILRQEAVHIGLSSAYTLQTQAQSLLYLKKNLFQFELNYFRPLGNPVKFLEGLLQHFSRLRDEDISAQQYISWVKVKRQLRSTPIQSGSNRGQKSKVESLPDEKSEIEKNLELAQAYKKFQELKVKDNVMDFGDLIFYVVKLFRERKNLAVKYKKQFKYILVDEFQDTNVAQYELIKLLSPPREKSRLTVVGDDSQSIYKFRGAAVSNILQFMSEYKGAKRVVLLDNFRSHQAILDAAYRLIKHNDPDTLEAKLGITKDLKSAVGRGNQTSVQFHPVDRVEEEADYVAKTILTLEKNGYHWSDCALLTRANSHADPFIRAFGRLGIPYQLLGQGILFKQPEVKDLIAYLKFMADVADSSSFYRVLTIKLFNLDTDDLARLVAFTKKTNLSLFETVEVYLSFLYRELAKPEYAHFKDHLFLIKQKTKTDLWNIYQLVKRSLSLIKKNTAGEILYDFLERSGMLIKLAAYKSEKEERQVLNISLFFDYLKSFEAAHEDASIFAVVDYLEMSMEFGESPLTSKTDQFGYDAVYILTVHGSKGLEFPIVFLVNLVADRFPTRERRETFPIPDELIKEILPEGDYHLQEERRLFYVGATRAKERVYLTAAQYYSEGKRARKISPFVIEALGETVVERQKEQKGLAKKQLSIFDFSRPTKKVLSAPQRPPVTAFSFSQIETFKTCPLRYKYQYVIKIPVVKNAAASFGESVHKTLQKFYACFKNGQKPTLETMKDCYFQSWIPLGYLSKAHELQMKQKGEAMLKRFYDSYHREDIKILDLEKWFKTKIDQALAIIGKIDRVDIRDDGKLEIIDYKTGKKPRDKELKNNLQLSLYALAASDTGLYRRKIDDIILTFYFLQENEAVSLQKTAAEVNALKEELHEVAAEINRSAFEPRVGVWCQTCPFKMNCEAWQ